jgi:mono/diheme cytochrome c family protein
MSVRSRWSLCALAVVLTALAAGCNTGGYQRRAVRAPSPPAAPMTVESQVAAGGAAFGRFCASCHGARGEGSNSAPALVGPGALPADPPASRRFRKTRFTTAADVASFAVAAMPPSGPKPTTDQYWAIVAFDLQANGVALSEPVGPHNAGSIVINR